MSQHHAENEQPEEGLEIPYDRIAPQTLHRMIEEFVTREWADLGDSGYTLEDKINQVLQQLETQTAKVVYDLTTESWNIIATKQLRASQTSGDA